MKKHHWFYEESPVNGKTFNIFKKGEKNMEATIKPEVKRSKTEKTKNTLSVYTYLNFRQFGLAVRIDDGIKTTVLWFETHITFEKR